MVDIDMNKRVSVMEFNVFHPLGGFKWRGGLWVPFFVICLPLMSMVVHDWSQAHGYAIDLKQLTF